VRRALLAIAAIAASIFAAGPVLWQLVTSLRTDQEMLDIGLPTTLTLDSYRAAFETQPLGRAMLNSLAVASTTTAACILLGAAAAFVLAKLDLRGGHAVLVAALLTSMFPSVAAVGSVYLALRAMGLYDHLLGLVLPYASFALPTTLWILHGFFRQIPDEIYRAAIIDGCTPLQAFWKVMLPLAAPGLATTAVLVQPFVPEIQSEGEWSLVFFGGAFSHAVLKVPGAGDYRVQPDPERTHQPHDQRVWKLHVLGRVDSGWRPRDRTRSLRTLLARLQQTLQELLTIEPFPPAVLLDHHVRDFVDSFVRREAASAFEALSPAADQIAGAALARVNYLVIAK